MIADDFEFIAEKLKEIKQENDDLPIPMGYASFKEVTCLHCYWVNNMPIYQSNMICVGCHKFIST